MSTLKLDEIKSLQGTGNTVITFNSSDKAVFASQPVVPVPAFQVIRSGNQNISGSTYVDVEYNIVSYDTNSWWDAVNYRYTPQIAGYYLFNSYCSIRATSPTRRIGVLVLNGTGGYNLFDTSDTGAFSAGSGSHLVYLNGTTDYVSIQAYIVGTSAFVASSIFSGLLVRAA